MIFGRGAAAVGAAAGAGAGLGACVTAGSGAPAVAKDQLLLSVDVHDETGLLARAVMLAFCAAERPALKGMVAI